MALWVRTQDRFELAKINSVYAGYQEKDKDYVIMGEKYNGGARLGSYATKERALEVLDEIQSKIKQQFIVKSSALMSLKDIDKEENRLTWKYDKEFIMQDSGFEIVPINDGTIVYEMPKK